MWVLLWLLSFPVAVVIFSISLILTPIVSLTEYVIKGRVDYLLMSNVVEKLDDFVNWAKPE